MASATIYARTDRSSGSEIPVYLRLTHKGERARMSLDLKLSARHWNGNKGRVRSSHPQSEYLNQYLSDVQATADGAIARLKSQGVVPSASRLKQEVQSELAGETGGDDFLEFCEKQLEGYRQRGQEGTFRNYRSVIRKFEEFWRSERSGTCRPSDLTVSLIEPTFRTRLGRARSIKFLISMAQHSNYFLMSFFHVQNNLATSIK
jgi:hypothetical protein